MPAKIEHIKLPFPDYSTPLVAQCSRETPLILIRDTNGAPIFDIGVTINGYLVRSHIPADSIEFHQRTDAV